MTSPLRHLPNHRPKDRACLLSSARQQNQININHFSSDILPPFERKNSGDVFSLLATIVHAQLVMICNVVAKKEASMKEILVHNPIL